MAIYKSALREEHIKNCQVKSTNILALTKRFQLGEDMGSTDNNRPGAILLVDDEYHSIFRIKAILDKDGYDIHIARNGLEGLRMARKIKPDLILMDITMPGLDGYDATSLIKKYPGLKETPVVFISARTPAEDMGNSYKVGGTAFINKSFSNQQLRETVAHMMNSVLGKSDFNVKSDTE